MTPNNPTESHPVQEQRDQAYEAPKVEKVLTAEALTREIHYAGAPSEIAIG
jgi:hypothetical protein